MEIKSAMRVSEANKLTIRLDQGYYVGLPLVMVVLGVSDFALISLLLDPPTYQGDIGFRIFLFFFVLIFSYGFLAFARLMFFRISVDGDNKYIKLPYWAKIDAAPSGRTNLQFLLFVVFGHGRKIPFTEISSILVCGLSELPNNLEQYKEDAYAYQKLSEFIKALEVVWKTGPARMTAVGVGEGVGRALAGNTSVIGGAAVGGATNAAASAIIFKTQKKDYVLAVRTKGEFIIRNTSMLYNQKDFPKLVELLRSNGIAVLGSD